MEQSAGSGLKREGRVQALSQGGGVGHSGAAWEDQDGRIPVSLDDTRRPPVRRGGHQGGTVEEFFRP